MKIAASLAVSTIIMTILTAAQSVAADNNSANRMVFLLIGQSNMAGRAEILAEDEAIPERCELFTDHGDWEPLKNPLNRYSRYRKEMGMQRLNPGYTFARKMAGMKPDATIGIVSCARGGTNIDEWERGEFLYDEAVARMRQAARSGTLAGILWHQGEANRDDTDYHLKIERLIENLREDLGMPGLPFVAGQVRKSEDWAVNKQIAELPDNVPGTAYVNSDGLETTDNWHFDTKSMRIFGERYADAMAKLLDR